MPRHHFSALPPIMSAISEMGPKAVSEGHAYGIDPAQVSSARAACAHLNRLTHHADLCHILKPTFRCFPGARACR